MNYALKMLHRPVHFAFVLLELEGFAFVEFFLTSAEGNVEFCTSLIIDEEQGGDDGESNGLSVFLQVAYLSLVEQQLAVSAGFVVVV